MSSPFHSTSLFQGTEISEIDASLLMSILEESQCEEHDDETLEHVIRSLEAEINFNTIDGYDLPLETEASIDQYDSQLWSGDKMVDHDCSQPLDFDVNWADMEIKPSSPFGETTNWYLDPSEVEVDGSIESGGRGFSHFRYGDLLEEDGYNFLWQDTYDLAMSP